jgi:hypothetical protein
MLGRMMVSALALMSGVASAQTTTPTPAPDAAANEAVATQPTSTSDRVIYEAAFFSRFNPQNAMDMVNNTPGFTLVFGDGRRGFSGSVSNVLVDGLRPTTKSEQIDAVLSRIPAGQIQRIEVLRGAAVAGDASGQATLINIVRTPTAGSGVYELTLEYTGQYQDRIVPRLDASYNGRNGQLEWGVGVRVLGQNRELAGDRRFYDINGDFEGRSEWSNPRDIWDPYYSANIAFPLLGGRFSANGMINPDWINEQENHFRNFDNTDTFTGAFDTRWAEEGTLSEIGMNYDRNFGPWALALVGLRTQHPHQYNERAVESDNVGAVERIIVVNSDREDIESILRGTLSRSLNPQNRIEFGGEGAINTLDSEFAQTIDTGGGPVPVALDGANVSVEEQRAEFFGVHTWRPNETWSLETRVAWETSTLTFTGDSNQETELSFWKPSVQLSRTFAGNNQLRLRFYRDVGQLDFDDFVSRTGLSDDLIIGGNPDLVPQTDWRAEFGGDLRFPGGAALGFALTYHDIADVNDQVPIFLADDPGTIIDESGVTSAPGNIGDAEAWSLDVNFSTRLPFVPNARITIDGEFWDTEVTDPVTGQPRIISYQPESQVDIAFRQDFAEQRWSWGIEYFRQGEVQGYRLNEIDTQEEGPWVDLWWETTALPNNMKLRLWAANIANGSVLRDRRFFASDDGDDDNNTRNDPFFRQILDYREFTTSPWFIMEISGSF